MATQADDVIKNYLGSVKNLGTRRSYSAAWNEWVKWLSTQNLGPVEARPRHVQAYVDDLVAKHLVRTSVGRALSALRSVYGVLVREEVLGNNPAREIKPPKNALTRERAPDLTDAEVRRMLTVPAETWFQRRDQMLLFLLSGTGWQRSEVARIHVEDLRDGSVAGTVKGDKLITVELPRVVLAAIADWRSFAKIETGALLPRRPDDPRPIDGAIVYRILRQTAERAGVPPEKNATPNALRRAIKALGAERAGERRPPVDAEPTSEPIPLPVRDEAIAREEQGDGKTSRRALFQGLPRRQQMPEARATGTQAEIASAIDDCLSKKKAGTQRSYRGAWARYVTWLETAYMDVGQARTDDVQRYLDELLVKSRGRAAVAYAALKEIYRALRLAKIVSDNPAREAKLPKSARSEPKTVPLTQEETKLLLDSLPAGSWAERRNRVLLLLLHRTGWRGGEVARLQVEDFHDNDVTGTVLGDKRETVELTKLVLAAIDDWKRFANIETGALLPRSKDDPRPIDRAIVYHIFRRAASRVGLPEEKRKPEALRSAIRALVGARRIEPISEYVSPLDAQRASQTLKLVDDQVVEALEKLGPELASCYRQGILDLLDPHRVSYVGPASELREVLSWVLHKLAPDDAVKASEGWKPETKDNRPTRRQRSEFILKTKLRANPGCRRTLENLTTGLDGLAGDLYERASKTTHTTSGERVHLHTYTTYLNALLRDLLL